MRALANVLVPLAVIGVALAGTPASVSAKCYPSIGIPRLAETLYIIDDEVADPVRMAALDRDEILSIHIACRDVKHPETGGPALQNAIEIMTRSGAPALMEAQLLDLVEAQRAHHVAHGSYAGTLDELDFLASRSRIGIRMTVNAAAGWSAVVEAGEPARVCHVAVGDAEVQHPEQAKGIPSCRTRGGAEASTEERKGPPGTP